jgi:hypothetical protein
MAINQDFTFSKELKMDYTNKRILFISDMHIPYHHEDAFDFLAALKQHYKPDLVVSLGDLLDFHNISFHDSDPDLLGAGDELSLSQDYIQDLETLFPKMIIVGSNHGDLPLRKFVNGGLPRQMLKGYNEIYGVGTGWEFVADLTIKVPGRDVPDLYACHNIKKNNLAVAQQRGQRVINGHFHESFNVQYAGNPNSLLWACTAGCLIDKRSLAFAYNKLNLNRPILGTAVVENGMPVLAPMLLDSDGYWVQEIL